MHLINRLIYPRENILSYNKTVSFFILAFFLLYSGLSFGQKGKNSQDIETILECVEYVGNGVYRANFGYNNPNKMTISVPIENSVVIYNKGQAKKNAINSFERGRKYNVFILEF